MTKIWRNIVILAFLSPLALCLSPLQAQEQQQPYLCDIGIQGGVGYYVGDANPHIFLHPREAYGILFRYKFTKNWAIQAKFSGQRIAGYDVPWEKRTPESKTWENQLFFWDVTAEFNFFRYGAKNENDKRVKPYTPYIFLGIGAGIHQRINDPSAWDFSGYVPFGIGFKWKCYDWIGLHAAWQHNIYFSDDLEGIQKMNDTHRLNGSNWMNCDLTGQLVVGIVFEFGRAKAPCVICNND